MNRNGVNHKFQQALKRAIDVAVSVSGLVLLGPVMGCVALAIKLDSEGSVVFRHRRIGQDGYPFDLCKFRTMVCGGDDRDYLRYLHQLIESERDGNGNGLPYVKMNGDSRVTHVGRILRCYYLDEFPQLWNIVRGEMSLVGPRPHVQFEVEYYTPEQLRRLSVKPGLTGLWQVLGKADCTFSQLIQQDLDYIDNWSLWRDIQIIFKTFTVMLRGGEEFWARMTKHLPGKAQAG